MGHYLLIKNANYSDTAIEDISSLNIVDYTQNLIIGYINPASQSTIGKTIVYVPGDYEIATSDAYVLNTKNGTKNSLFMFDDGDVRIFIPNGLYYRICVSKLDGDGIVSEDSIIRGNQIYSNGVTIKSPEIPNLLGGISKTTYPYWGINISKTEYSQAQYPRDNWNSVEEAIATGITVKKYSI